MELTLPTCLTRTTADDSKEAMFTLMGRLRTNERHQAALAQIFLREAHAVRDAMYSIPGRDRGVYEAGRRAADAALAEATLGKMSLVRIGELLDAARKIVRVITLEVNE